MALLSAERRSVELAAPLPESFWTRVEVSDCWAWLGAKDQHGYGRTRIEGKTRSAHRACYESLVGIIDAGLVLDHLCKNRECVNPDHLEPVTQAVNVRRGVAGRLCRLRAERQTECPNGHPYEEGSIKTDWRGLRECKACRRAKMNRRNAKRRKGAGYIGTTLRRTQER